MSTVIVSRPPRREGPALPSGDVTLEPPPALPQPASKQLSQYVMMVPMLAGGAAMALMYSTLGGGGRMSYIVGGLFGLSALGVAGMAFAGQGAPRREMARARRGYLRHLSQQRIRARRAVVQQRKALSYLHPDPTQLWTLVESYRLWERRRNDTDFAIVRVGTGAQPLATTVAPPDTVPLEELEPLSAGALRRFITTYSSVPGLPVAMALRGFSRVYVDGDPDRARSLARALVAQLATFHSPDDLLITAVIGPETRADWEWLKWLPHAHHPEKSDALGPIRLISKSVPDLESVLGDLLAQRPRFDPAATSRVDDPHIVVLIDGGDVIGSDHLMTGNGVEGVSVIDLTTQPPRLLDRSTVLLDVASDGALTSVTMDGESEVGIADSFTIPDADALARLVAPLRLSAGGDGEESFASVFGLTDLLGLGDPYTFDPAQHWGPRPNRDRLRVRFGVTADGTPVELDLKESAQDGMGPHGLLIGATGSGKSELLRSLVLALAATHSSESLNFALVDFKGGATFTKLDRLPHTSAVITNLSDELALVDRMADAIGGELIRRQELLRRAGNYESVREYELARAAGADLPEVPTLLVICDEFSELLSAKPDFIEMFNQIGRLGRALGVHLLLASQKLEEGRLRGLDAHLSYRIGLRTFSAMDSRVVLGIPDAYELPRAPGHGFLQIGTETLVRFRSAYVSGVHRAAASVTPTGGDVADEVAEYTSAYVSKPVTEVNEQPEEDGVGEKLLDILVDRLENKGEPARQIWLPPLDDPPPLTDLLPALTVDPDYGLAAAGPRGTLRVPIGLVDKPLEQRRDPLVVDLSAGAGHAVVVGGPRSGKSTAIRALVSALALTHTPREVQFYCLDFGGGSLGALREFPHVGGVAPRLDVGAVRRTIAEVQQLLTVRERYFAENGVESMASYRERRAAGEFADDPWGDVFLVVDGWPVLRSDFEDLEATLGEIAGRGLAYGVHVIASCSRWFDLRGTIRDLFGTRIELRLGDPSDSVVDRRAAMSVPADKPGRGLADKAQHFVVATPTADLGPQLAAAWPVSGAPRVRLLPVQLREDEFTAVLTRTPAAGLPIGLAERDLGPVSIDFEADPHFLLFGDTESGKTGFLRRLARSITERYEPTEARIILVDYRRSLTVAGEHVMGTFSEPRGVEAMVADLLPVLERRQSGEWTGPQIHILVDDYDLVVGQTNPLSGLTDYLAHGRDIGLHLVITRRSGGAGRAIYEPLIARLRDLGTPGLLMSGDKSEGPLLGTTKPESLPPGRGRLVGRRGDTQLVQLVECPDEPDGER
ncbi:type VII secretion protein EccCa [Kribbella sindirgiensis]|uniref:Type VII secretion protein EccCa n=1 Tax=Kribbella sindirgiensis TaxID=1124744 RepID=A0A4R0I0R5_9ACTN|nr:type VII secretion protein EccCa [Kribbella sindirgiensis]TCC18631.1 type VII secretion protein EccCa [Kribbella sindirgiensis]